MGTVFQISVAEARADQADPAIRSAFDEIARLENSLSEWLPGSEVSRINARAGQSALQVGPDTLTVVKAGLDVSRWSLGAFDLSWAAMRGLYRFQPDERRVPSAMQIRKRLPLIDWERIELNEPRATVRLTRKGMALGTGGIAKGHALDRAAAILRKAGLKNFMLFGGGQVQVYGKRGPRPWRVGIQHPRTHDYFAFIETEASSISTSGDYEHYFVDDRGKRWHHILDPKTGLPAAGVLSVTVLASSGLYGDALSTACFVLGPKACIERMATAPGTAEAIVVDDKLKVFATPGTAEKLRWRMRLVDGKLPSE